MEAERRRCAMVVCLQADAAVLLRYTVGHAVTDAAVDHVLAPYLTAAAHCAIDTGDIAASGCFVSALNLTPLAKHPLLLDTLKAVAQHCHNLERLSVAECRGAGPEFDEAVAAVVAANPMLRHFSARGATCVGDATLRALGEHCPGLLHLDVAMTYGNVTDAGLVALGATGATQLCRLDVSSTGGKVSAQGIEAVAAAAASSLRVLSAGMNKGAVGDDSLCAVAQHCGELAVIELQGTAGAVTTMGLHALAAGCPLLEAADLSFTGQHMATADIVSFTTAFAKPALRTLTAKGMGFTEAEKAALRPESITLVL